MNDDHPADSLLIARAFATSDATASVMTSLDEHGGTWAYTADGADHSVTVPWSKEISERAEIRREIVELYDAACGKLGLTPRDH